MKAIEQAKAHFKTLKTKTIEVAEWGGEDGQPLVIYVEPFTLKDKAKLQAVTKVTGSEIDALVELVVMKSLDKNGEKLFTIEDKHALRNAVDSRILERISGEIMRVDFEALEKN
jgi:hypothetical protein